MTKNIHAFTLVELIVVVTILAILWTLGFISLSSYGSIARESVRSADINTLMRALNLAHLENNVYPETASGMTVTFSGATLWTQGFFNDQVRNALKKVPDTPLDPVTDSPYIYSVSYNRQEYQLARGSEGGLLSMSSSIIPTAEADFSTLKVRWNYNGAILDLNIGGELYVLWIPSLLTTLSGSSIDIADIYSSRSFAQDGFWALPYALMAEGQTSSPVNFPSGSGDVDASRFVLHQGTREELTQDNIVLNLSQKLYDLYAESSLNAVSSIQSLTEINPADATTPTDQALLVFTTMQYLQSLPSFRSGGYTAPTPPPPANNSGTTPEPEGQEPIEPTPTPNPEPEPEPNPCPLPWWGSLASGNSVGAFEFASVTYGNTCTQQTRICQNGALSWTFTYESCSVDAPIVDIERNIAPEATLTATHSSPWNISGIANGVKRTDGAFDYEYHSSSPNGFINFDFSSPREIGAVKIYNRTGCCSERLSWAQLQIYDVNNTLLYTHTLPASTQGMREIDINFLELDQIHMVKRINLRNVNGQVINIREIEIFPIK